MSASISLPTPTRRAVIIFSAHYHRYPFIADFERTPPEMDGLRNGQTPSQTGALLDVNGSIAEFVHRFQSLSVHRDSQDNLIKVCVCVCF